MADQDDELIFNGIDGATGQPVFQPLSVAEVAARTARGYGGDPLGSLSGVGSLNRGDADIASGGWGVVVPKGLDPAFRRAIEPLCALRRRQAGELYKEIELDPEKDDFRSFCERHGVSPGNMDPALLPRYLLLLGPPKLIPFELQCLLGLEYGPGRLDLRTPEACAAYAESVVAYETASSAPTARELHFWGPRHDAATELSSTQLLAPLFGGWQGATESVGKAARYPSTASLEDQATKEALLRELHRPLSTRPPTLLFTASHGVGWPLGHERQATEQGALVTADWFPGAPVSDPSRLAASDIGDNARVFGMVAFLFACFGAATPELDTFPRDPTAEPTKIAPEPFGSALPQRLLSHPGGGALGVFGHVDRAWGFSIKPLQGIPQIGPFRTGLLRMLRGAPLGDVLSDFARRAAGLSSTMVSAFGARRPVSDRDLALRFIERNDAMGYVLLGDPGASVRKDVKA